MDIGRFKSEKWYISKWESIYNVHVCSRLDHYLRRIICVHLKRGCTCSLTLSQVPPSLPPAQPPGVSPKTRPRGENRRSVAFLHMRSWLQPPLHCPQKIRIHLRIQFESNNYVNSVRQEKIFLDVMGSSANQIWHSYEKQGVICKSLWKVREIPLGGCCGGIHRSQCSS